MMQESTMAYVLRALVVVLLVLVALLPLYSGGTIDVLSWLGWIEGIERSGLISAFANGELVYPPLAWAILQGVALFAHALNMEMFLALKWTLVAFLLFTSGVFLLWTRNLFLTAILHLSLVLSSVALGYLDIWFTPTLLLAFWALKERKIFLFTVFFTVSCLIKWQPVIIGPFLLAYVIRLTDLTQWRAALRALLREVVLPGGVITGAVLLLFGPAVLISFQNSMSHVILSGNALNYNWLLTYYLRLTQPERFGPLANGLVEYVDATDWPTIGVSKILFALFYAVTLGVFLRRPKSFENLLRFTIVGYLSYFTFNTGVHENHLFLAGLLGVVLYWVNPRDPYTTLILVLIANINLFLFYGIKGDFPYQRVVGIDLTLPLALFNVVFFLLFWAMTCWHGNPDSKGDVQGQPGFDRTDNVSPDRAVPEMP
jgi:hypothetical protein